MITGAPFGGISHKLILSTSNWPPDGSLKSQFASSLAFRVNGARARTGVQASGESALPSMPVLPASDCPPLPPAPSVGAGPTPPAPPAAPAPLPGVPPELLPAAPAPLPPAPAAASLRGAPSMLEPPQAHTSEPTAVVKIEIHPILCQRLAPESAPTRVKRCTVAPTTNEVRTSVYHAFRNPFSRARLV